MKKIDNNIHNKDSSDQPTKGVVGCIHAIESFINLRFLGRITKTLRPYIIQINQALTNKGNDHPKSSDETLLIKIKNCNEPIDNENYQGIDHVSICQSIDNALGVFTLLELVFNTNVIIDQEISDAIANIANKLNTPGYDEWIGYVWEYTSRRHVFQHDNILKELNTLKKLLESDPQDLGLISSHFEDLEHLSATIKRIYHDQMPYNGY